MSDPETRWKECDSNNGGMILFEEFCQWAILQNLDLQENDDDDEDEKELPPATPKKKINLTVKIVPTKKIVEKVVVKEEQVQKEPKKVIDQKDTKIRESLPEIKQRVTPDIKELVV